MNLQILEFFGFQNPSPANITSLGLVQTNPFVYQADMNRWEGLFLPMSTSASGVSCYCKTLAIAGPRAAEFKAYMDTEYEAVRDIYKNKYNIDPSLGPWSAPVPFESLVPDPKAKDGRGNDRDESRQRVEQTWMLVSLLHSFRV